MDNVIEFPKARHINTHLADRNTSVRQYETTYVCRGCDERIVARTLWVDAEIDCRCGTRMEAR